MKLYAIHAPIGPELVVGSDAARAAKTGFSLAAFLFGPLWLLAGGLWLALAGYVLAAAGIAALVGFGGLRLDAAMGLFAIVQLYLGLEGRGLAVVARARNGRPLVDVIYAGSALEAEKIHLERALAARAAPELDRMFPEVGR